MKFTCLSEKDQFKFQCKIAILSISMLILGIIALALMILDCFILSR